MPLCQAQNAMGWMLATWPLYQERCTATSGVQLQRQGRMCLMVMVRSFAVAQIGIWREYVAVFRLTLTDLNCVVFLKESFKVLHDYWSLEVTYVNGVEFCELNAVGSILYVSSLCVMWEGTLLTRYYGSKFTGIDWVGCGMRWRFFVSFHRYLVKMNVASYFWLLNLTISENVPRHGLVGAVVCGCSSSWYGEGGTNK